MIFVARKNHNKVGGRRGKVMKDNEESEEMDIRYLRKWT